MPKDIINIIHFPCKFYGSFFKEALVAGHVQFFFAAITNGCFIIKTLY